MSDKNAIRPFEVPKTGLDPLDRVQIGDFFWLKIDDEEWDEKKGNIKVGEHEELFCVCEIGSNYVSFERPRGSSTIIPKIHFDEFLAKARPEPKWKEVLQKDMDEIQKSIREKMAVLVERGRKLYLLPKPQDETPEPQQPRSLLPAKVSDQYKTHKKALIRFRDKSLPSANKEIEELASDFSDRAKMLAMPDLVKLRGIKLALEVVEDRIFTIELYCGIQETVVQIADGEPAPATEKIAIRQLMLYMDEETLFDYQSGGMDFKSLQKFDRWVAKPENLRRIIPEPKGIVAFRVRRQAKDYGSPASIADILVHLNWDAENLETYLLIRNGERAYRIASSINFSPRLVPMRGEIGEKQFKTIDERWVHDREDPSKTVREEKLITPDHIEYDKIVAKLDAILRQYNRIVIVIQGLLDRSTVLSPHPPVHLAVPGQIDEWIRLVRDEEDGLPANQITFEEYQKQLNSTLCRGKWVYIDSKYEENFKDGQRPYDPSNGRYSPRPRRGWNVNSMPDIIRVETMKRDGSAVRVSWPWGECATVTRFVESKDKPGWGHYEPKDTGRMCHEWIPTNRVLNVSDYNAGDYKMFLCDHALKGEYLKWAQYLLTAEDWAQHAAAGKKPEDFQKTKK